MNQITEATKVYALKVQEAYNMAYSFCDPSDRPTVEISTGKRFYKLIVCRGRGSGGASVHSFVDRETGDVFKPAGWNAPAKGARYNLATGLDFLLSRVDYTGGYLYAGRYVRM